MESWWYGACNYPKPYKLSDGTGLFEVDFGIECEPAVIGSRIHWHGSNKNTRKAKSEEQKEKKLVWEMR